MSLLRNCNSRRVTFPTKHIVSYNVADYPGCVANRTMLAPMIPFTKAVCVVMLIPGPALCLAESSAGLHEPAAAVPERLAFVQRATHLIALPIHDRQDHEVGRIEDFVINLGSGQILGVLAAPPHIYGDFRVFIPAASFVSAGDDRAVLTGDRTNLLAEPCVSREVFESPDFSKKIVEAYTRFGATSVWKDQDGPRGFIKFSQVSGFKIRNRSQENLGQAADLILDLPAGRIVFLVASLDTAGHSFYAVPPSALDLDPQDSTLVLSADKAPLAKAAQSSNFIWAQMNNPNWATATYRLYGQEPGIIAPPQPDSAPVVSENLFPKIEGSSMTVRIVKPPTYSDSELTRKIMAAIVNEAVGASLTENKVQVTTVQGRVTLRGQSSSADQKDRLRAIAEGVAGHGNVDDQIEIAQ